MEFPKSQVSRKTGVLGAYLGVMVTELRLRKKEQWWGVGDEVTDVSSAHSYHGDL